MNVIQRACMLLLLACFAAQAAEPSPEQTPSQSSIWGIGLAVGVGERSNPLYGGEDIPLVVLPEVFYYGEKLYFDNGRLGLYFYEKPTYEWSLAVRLNPERAYFSRRYLGNWLSDPFAPRSGQGQTLSVPLDAGVVAGGEQSSVTVETVQSRDWSLDGGIQLDWEPHRRWLVRANLWTDVTNRHGGHNAQVQLSRMVNSNFGQWTLRADLDWKSSALIDYYYGVSALENDYSYAGKSVLQPAVGLYWNYPLNGHWRMLGFARKQWLGSGMSDSPLVRDTSVHSVFL